MLLQPPYSPLNQLSHQLEAQGYSVLAPNDFYELTKHGFKEWQGVSTYWNNLPPDAYLKDGGRYRQRRHASFVVKQGELSAVPHRAHWQPVSYNALHGGIDRWFEPCEAGFAKSDVLRDFLIQMTDQFNQVKGSSGQQESPWYVEVHQFRIDTTDGIGRPTPEGAHRDGVDFVAVLMLDRQGIKGGETRVFEAAGPQGQRFTLIEPCSLLVLDDARVIHETTPIQPLHLDSEAKAWRDTLVVTFRRGGFQDSSLLTKGA